LNERKIEKNHPLYDYFIAEFCEQLGDFQKLKECVEAAIDLERAQNFGEFIIRPSFHEKLLAK